MELGVFSLTDIYPGSGDTAASRIDDIIGYGVLAEQTGLDVFGIGEHHEMRTDLSTEIAGRAGEPFPVRVGAGRTFGA